MRLSLVFLAATVGCAPFIGTPADAGPIEPQCEGGGAQSVRAGHTGVEFVSIEDGDELPAWTRPQGGIGTRINVSLAGYSDEQQFDSLTIQFIGTEAGAACTDDDDPACSDLEMCDDGECRLLLGNQTNVRFPLECLEDGSLHIAELPVRFRNQFELSELDNVEQELRLTVVPRQQEPMTTSVRVTLQVGEFIQPSWWETGEP